MKTRGNLFLKYGAIVALIVLSFFLTTSDFNSNLAYAQKKKISKRKKKRKRKEEKFSLNFKDTDIAEFTKHMSQIIKKNIILDNQVRGKITISSAKKVPVKNAYDVFKSILEVKGYGIVETENIIKVIPIRDALKKTSDVVSEGSSIIVDGKQRVRLKGDNSVTYLLELKYADATEVSNALRPLKSKYSNVIVYKSLNTIILNGSSAEVKSLRTIAKTLDVFVPEDDEDPTKKQIKGNLHVVHLQNANAVELVEVLSRVPFSETAKVNKTSLQYKKKGVRPSSKSKRVTRNTRTNFSRNKSKLSIIASKETNSLIIVAKPAEFKQILRVIKELDTVREQVLIEALIVEVSATNQWGFGINWMLGQQFGSNMFGGSQILDTSLNSTFTDPTGLGKTPPVPINPGFQIGYLYDASVLSYALLNASKSDENFNILSTPQIVTIDNQEAELNVGEEIPVQSDNRISDSGTQFFTYEYKSVGIKLKLTPHITKQDKVTLDLYQEVSSVSDLGTGEKPPTLLKRDLKTKVTVLNNKTIVVGGLIRNNKNVTENKVPLLGDIPLLGWFFKHKAVSYQKTNLLIFITPHIITKQEDIDRVTRQKQDEQELLRIGNENN